MGHDHGQVAASLVLVYSPTGRSALAHPGAQQIGYFRPSASVETASTAVANNVALLAKAIVLNYLALHDRVGSFASVLPSHGLGSGASFNALIAFEPIAE